MVGSSGANDGAEPVTNAQIERVLDVQSSPQAYLDKGMLTLFSFILRLFISVTLRTIVIFVWWGEVSSYLPLLGCFCESLIFVSQLCLLCVTMAFWFLM